MSSQSCVKLFTGREIPLLGLGTWKSKKGEVKAAVRCAVEAGYRHIDCAWIYGNEKEVGEALSELMAEGVVRREELFITSKLWNTKHRPDDVRPALQETLTSLQLEYVDLYLIHWPTGFAPGEATFPWLPDGKTLAYDDTHFLSTWAAMETLVEEGVARHIGLSNFNSKQVDEVMSKCKVQPAALQCECHALLPQNELITHAAKYGIVFQAYSPLGSPDRPWAKPDEPTLLNSPKIIEIGKKYGKSPAQVLIRFQVQRGVCVLPKSVTPERIRANFNVLDFELSEEDMKTLKFPEKQFRACLPSVEIDGKKVPRERHHPHFPFGIPY